MSDLKPSDQDRATYGCPDWCRRLDHDADVVDAMNPPTHYGPEWANGEVVAQVASGAHPEAVICVDDETIYIHDPARIRHLAAGLLQAAQWIEVHR